MSKTTQNKKAFGRTFKNIPALHRLLESAPVAALQALLLQVDEGQYAHCFAEVDWPISRASDAVWEEVRHCLLQAAEHLPEEKAIPLEQHAQRLLNLSEGRGIEALQQISVHLCEPTQRVAYEAQRDDYGRAIWLYLNAAALFDDAETLFYTCHYRYLGCLYEAFEVGTGEGLDFQWNEAVQLALESQLQSALDLNERCQISHIQLTSLEPEGAKKSYLLIIRHAGPLSSISTLQNRRKQPIYYRPAVEATLLFSPHEAVIEVFASSPALRPRIAAVFAQTGLKQELSNRPLTLRQYDLSRFLISLRLDVPTVAGYEIVSVTVISVEVRPSHLKHCVMLRVAIEEDIEAVASELFGPNHLFQRAALVSRIVIAVRYVVVGDTKIRTLNLTLSDPNRCNLRNNCNPKQRALGFALLSHWGILRPVRVLDAAKESALFPTLLKLYDEQVEYISRYTLERLGIAVQPLQDSGFLVRCGQCKTLDITLDDGQIQRVIVYPAPTPGHARYACPISGKWIDLPYRMLEEYRIQYAWIETRVVKGLHASLRTVRQVLHPNGLMFLGELTSTDKQPIPVYLARQLHDMRMVRACDLQLRARHEAGTGIVLACSEGGPDFLGPHVVVPLASVWVKDQAPIVDVARLTSIYLQGKGLARESRHVLFKVTPNRTGTLFLPGKPPLTLVGAQQIMLIQRLVDAYYTGNSAVTTKELIADTNVRSLRQAFRHWQERIVNVYIGQADRRGAWKLLV